MEVDSPYKETKITIKSIHITIYMHPQIKILKKVTQEHQKDQWGQENQEIHINKNKINESDLIKVILINNKALKNIKILPLVREDNKSNN